MFERREQIEEKEEVAYYFGLPGQCGDEETIYEEDIPTDSEKQRTGQYGSEDLSVYLLLQLQKVTLLDCKEIFMKSMGNARNFHHLFGKPCIQHSLLHLPVLLSASFLKKKMEMLWSQVSSDEWRSRTWAHLKLKI